MEKQKKIIYDGEHFRSVKQLIEHLGVSYSKFYRNCRDGLYRNRLFMDRNIDCACRTIGYCLICNCIWKTKVNSRLYEHIKSREHMDYIRFAQYILDSYDTNITVTSDNYTGRYVTCAPPLKIRISIQPYEREQRLLTKYAHDCDLYYRERDIENYKLREPIPLPTSDDESGDAE